MNKLLIILTGFFATGTFTFAQEETRKVRPQPQSYEQRVERGFGQLFEPLWAGDRPAWFKREEAENRTQRIEIVIEHKGMGRQFRGRESMRQCCPFCEKHKEMVEKKPFNKKEPRRNRQRGFRH